MEEKTFNWLWIDIYEITLIKVEDTHEHNPNKKWFSFLYFAVDEQIKDKLDPDDEINYTCHSTLCISFGFESFQSLHHSSYHRLTSPADDLFIYFKSNCNEVGRGSSATYLTIYLFM